MITRPFGRRSLRTAMGVAITLRIIRKYVTLRGNSRTQSRIYLVATHTRRRKIISAVA